MTDPLSTPPRPSNPEEAAHRDSPSAAPADSAEAADVTEPVPAVPLAPPGLESVTGETGYTARHASDSETPGTTARSRSDETGSHRPLPDERTFGRDTSSPTTSGTATSSSNSSSHEKSDQAKGAAQDVAGDAKDAGRAVKDTAAQEAAGVKDDAVREAKRLGGEAGTMLETQAADQLDRAAGTVRTFSDDVARIARGEKPEPGVAKDLVDQLNTRAEAAATWLEEHDPREVLDEVQSFARRRPVAFLAIAAGVGFAAGRLTRGVRQNHADDTGRNSAAGRSNAARTSNNASTGHGTAAPVRDTGAPVSGDPAGGLPAYEAGPGTPTPGYTGGTDPYAGGGGR